MQSSVARNERALVRLESPPLCSSLFSATFLTPTSGLVGSLDQEQQGMIYSSSCKKASVVRELDSSVLQTSPCGGDCAQNRVFMW